MIDPYDDGYSHTDACWACGERMATCVVANPENQDDVMHLCAGCGADWWRAQDEIEETQQLLQEAKP